MPCAIANFRTARATNAVQWAGFKAGDISMRLPAFLTVFFVLASMVGPIAPAAAEDNPADLLAACDRAAASQYDKSLPPGIAGITPDKVDPTIAIPACEAAVKVAPANARILFELGRAYNAAKDYEPARANYEKADRLGNVLATNNLAGLYATGRGGAVDDVHAAQLFRKAADAGITLAMNALAGFYQNGRGGLPKDDSQAAHYYRLAADGGYAPAQTSIGYFYETGRGGLPKDDGQAVRYYKLAADQGNPPGENNLGIFYLNGRGGLPKDGSEAVRLYKLAADKNNANARTNLGYLYETGRGGVTKDEVEAARLYKLAADQGNPAARNHLGTFYESGRGGLPKDDNEAARYYKLAADQGYAPAQANIAFFIESARGGMTKDDIAAARYYKLAVDQGNAPGQNNLGVFYQYGRGGLQKDDREAARLYRLAADQGNVNARTSLGFFYETGRGGLPKDPREAARLYKLAADAGYAPAQKGLDRVSQQASSRAVPVAPPPSTAKPVDTATTAAPAASTAQPAIPPSGSSRLAIAAERRVALVIGNSAYQSVVKLPNTTNDANAIAAALKATGFSSVRVAADDTRAALITALSDFQHDADNADWAVVFYAGHGLEVNGINYLVPVDARLRDDRNVQDEAISINRLLDAISGAKKLRLVILDACRDNPFLQIMRRSNPTRGVSRGLAAVEPVGATLVVFAAKDGETAQDGAGDHSPFTASLLKRIQEPGVEINRLFRLVTGDVLKATGNVQRPFVYGSLPGEDDYFFRLR